MKRSYEEHRTDHSYHPKPWLTQFTHSQVDGLAATPSDISALGTYGREVRDMLHSGSGKEELQTYVHFANGDETPATWYSSAKLGRLVELKSVYDPAGLFSWYNPVLFHN